MSESQTSPNFVELAADIVSAYVSNNSVPSADLPMLLNTIYTALTQTAQGQSQEPKAELVPAVPVKKSVTPDYIICLEDGKKFKSLKRHLRTTYNLSPDQYRAKWGLPSRLPDGGSELCQGALRTGQDHGPRPAAQEGTGDTRQRAESQDRCLT